MLFQVPQDEVDVPEELPIEIDEELIDIDAQPLEINEEPIEIPVDLIDQPMDEPVMAINPTFLRRTISKKIVTKKPCRKPVTVSNCHRPITTKRPAPKKALKKHLHKAHQPQVRNC